MNAQNIKGNTGLHFLLAYGYEETAEYFITRVVRKPPSIFGRGIICGFHFPAKNLLTTNPIEKGASDEIKNSADNDRCTQCYTIILAMWGVLMIHLMLKHPIQDPKRNQSQQYGDETIRQTSLIYVRCLIMVDHIPK